MMLLPLNYKALYTLNKGRYNLRINTYLLSFIILNSEVNRVFFVKISNKYFDNKSFKARFLLF